MKKIAFMLLFSMVVLLIFLKEVHAEDYLQTSELEENPLGFITTLSDRTTSCNSNSDCLTAKGSADWTCVNQHCLYKSDPYHTKDEHISRFMTLCDSYKKSCSYISVGKTYDNKDIWMFRIGNPNGGTILWDAQLHGNEDVGSEILYWMAEWLLKDGTTGIDPNAQRIINGNYILFIPVINSLYRRGNADTTGCDYGVNLNRNFFTGFQKPTGDLACRPGVSCTAKSDCSGINDGNFDCDKNGQCVNVGEWHGPAAESEIETQVLHNVMNQYRPVYYVNMHQGLQEVIYYNTASGVGLAAGTESKRLLSRVYQLQPSTGYFTSQYKIGWDNGRGYAMDEPVEYFGAKSSWMIEVEDSWVHSDTNYVILQNDLYPRLLLFLRAQAEGAESTGLVGYWKFDEGSGTTTADNSGKGNTGTLTNGPTWSCGRAIKALRFDGVNDYVNVPDSNSLDLTNAITVSAWIYPKTWSSTYPRIVSKEASTSADPYTLELDNANKCAMFCINAGAGETCVNSGVNTISLNTWYHIAGTWDGAQSKIYINGVLKGTPLSLTGIMSATTNNVLIGNNPNNNPPNNRQYGGIIDDVKIYNYALTASEVASEYSSTPMCSGNVKLTLSSSLVAPGSSVTATVSGMTNCNGKVATVVKTSPSPPSSECSCTVSGNGCSCQFTSPSVGSYTLTGKVDKDCSDEFGGYGETFDTSLTVSSGGGCGKGCFVLAIGPYLLNIDPTAIAFMISIVLTIIEIFILIMILMELKKRKR